MTGKKNCAEESSLKRSKEKTEEEGISLEKEWVTHQILDDESCESLTRSRILLLRWNDRLKE